MMVKIKVYDRCKYDEESRKVAEPIYNAKELNVRRINDEEIKKMGFDEPDEYQEYTIISFEDGTTSTFRNSHVDIFIN